MNYYPSLIALLLFIVFSSVSQANNTWTQFRGPNASGVAHDAKPPVELSPDQNVKWKTKIASGLSCPIIWDNKLFITTFADNKLHTVCMNASNGKEIWSQTAPSEKIERHHPDNSPAASTPVVDEHHVYVYFGSFGLICYDHDGNEKWQHPISTPINLHGTATSPVLYKDFVYLMHDSMNGDSYMLAVNKKDGTEAWKTKRTVFNPNWSTPVIWSTPHGDQLIQIGGGMLQAYDPLSGNELWTVKGFGAPIPVPVIGDEYLYASTVSATDLDVKVSAFTWDYHAKFDTNGDRKIETEEIPEDDMIVMDPDLPNDKIPAREMIQWVDKDQDKAMSQEEFQGFMDLIMMNVRSSIQAIKPGGDGDVTQTHVAWKYERSIPYMPSALYHNGRIYMAKSGGVVTCLDAKTGKQIYRKRVGAHGNYSSSPVAANNHIYIFSQNGALTVLKAGDDPEVISRSSFDERVQTTPAISGNTFYVRTEDHLYAFQNQ